MDLATYIRTWTAPGLREHEERCRKYDELYKVYRADYPSGTADPWQSRLRVKYAMQIVDTALVNVVNGRPHAKVSARQPQDEASAKAMQAALNYAIQEDHLVEKEPVFVQQALIFGVTAAKNRWVYEKGEQITRVPLETDAGVQYVPVKRNAVLRDGPTFEPWSVYDIWWDPNARDVDEAEYVVLRSYVSKDQLLKAKYDPENGTGVYQNVEKLFELGTVAQPSSRTVDRSSEKKKDKYELWEVWRKTRTGLKVTVLGNKQVVLRDTPWDFLGGRKPIVITQVRPDLFEMAGVSEIELVDHLQQALHTVQNMRMDNWHLTTMRGITYREGGVTDPNALELRPRFKWPVQDHDDVKPFEVAPLPREAYEEESQLLARMQLVTGINPYISGSNMDSVDQNTATGVTVLSEVASRLLRFKAKMILEKGFQRTYEQWAAMIQQLQDQTIWTKVIGEDGQAAWQAVTPADIQGQFDIIIEGSEESLSRQQERGEAVALLNSFAPFAGMVDMKPVLERVGQAYNMPDLAKIMQPPAQQQQPAAPSPQATGSYLPQTMPQGSSFPPGIASSILNGGQ